LTSDTARTTDLAKVLVASRCVSIFGKPGMGKSALAQATVNFIQERVKFDGGCVYVNCKNKNTYEKFE
jgi:sigma54-dependent transcription regulator